MAVNKKELAPLTFPKNAAEQMVKEYLHSKTTNADPKKFPEWDVPRNDPSVELVAKRRDLFDAELRLAEKQKEAIKRRKETDALWNDLENREKILKDNFIKFNKFVKENQEKRERAERKISEEAALIQKRSKDIEDLKTSYEYMFDIRHQMEQNIRSHKLYEDYLRNVAKIYPIFKTADDILDRYETLADARKILAERQETDLTALEEARNEMLKITEENTLKIMGLNNIMTELQSRYEIAKNKALQWELIVTKIKNASVTKLAELHAIRQSSWTMYLQMCKRKEILPEIDKEDIENQLLFIKRTMLELKRITKIVRRRATRDSYPRPGSQSTKH